MDKILYLEDDREYAARLTESIKSFEFELIHNIEDLKKIKDFSQYKILLSDLYVNTKFNEELISIISRINIPVAVISSTDKAEDEYMVFNNNINEFISKSSLFEVVELKLKKFIKTEGLDNLTFKNNGVTYHLLDDSCIVTDKSFDVNLLSSREFRILKYLLINKNRPVKREEIYWELYKKQLIDSEKRVVDVYINMLRNKLNLKQIKSVRGVGYKWEDEK